MLYTRKSNIFRNRKCHLLVIAYFRIQIIITQWATSERHLWTGATLIEHPHINMASLPSSYSSRGHSEFTNTKEVGCIQAKESRRSGIFNMEVSQATNRWTTSCTPNHLCPGRRRTTYLQGRIDSETSSDVFRSPPDEEKPTKRGATTEARVLTSEEISSEIRQRDEKGKLAITDREERKRKRLEMITASRRRTSKPWTSVISNRSNFC